MKICFIGNAASQHTWKWVNYFVKEGNEVHIISHEPYELSGVIVHHLDFSLKNFFKYKKIVHSKIKEINPDVLHAHQLNDCGLYGVTYKKNYCIVSAWGSDVLVNPKKSLFMKCIVKYIIKNAYCLTSDADQVTDAMVNLGANKEKIYTFPMGISEEIMKNRCNINLHDDNLNILSNRRLEKLYNIDTIIEGFALAIKEEYKMKLTIAATGTESDILKEKVKELGIEGKVEFVGGYDEQKLGELLRTNEVFISIPSSDGTSVSLLEALGCGLYPILSPLPSNREWVTDNGIVLSDISPKDVKEALLYCFRNRNELRNIQKYNIRLIENKALWKNNILIIKKIYEKVGE